MTNGGHGGYYATHMSVELVGYGLCTRSLRFENFKGTDYVEDLDVDGRMILNWILQKEVMR
jgi:hypothetical protein